MSGRLGLEAKTTLEKHIATLSSGDFPGCELVTGYEHYLDYQQYDNCLCHIRVPADRTLDVELITR